METAHRKNEARRAMLDLEVLCAVVGTLGGKSGPVKTLMKKLQEQS